MIKSTRDILLVMLGLFVMLNIGIGILDMWMGIDSALAAQIDAQLS